MAKVFTITPQPIRVTATGYQPIFLATDVGAFDILDVQLGIVSFEGTTPGVTVELYTGMQNVTNDGWVALSSFGAQSVGNTWLKANFVGGFLRYLRWNVTALTGTAPAATFFIRGVGRNYA